MSFRQKESIHQSIHFVCQKCRQALQLDSSLNELAILQEMLTESISATSMKDSQISVAFRESEFAVVEDPGSEKTDGSLSHRVKTQAALFDFLSGETEFDHPLCEDCTDTLLQLLDEQLKAAQLDCQRYRELLDDLEAPLDVDVSQLDGDIEQLESEERQLRAELASLALAQQQIVVDKEAEHRLRLEEDRMLREYSSLKRSMLRKEDELRSTENQSRSAQVQLDKLKKTNVFNATFHIWHKDHFGTINGFRLGRLASVPVEWAEINAAWGQACLLLCSLARKMGLQFTKFRPVPFGNFSYIECLDEKGKQLPLYATGGVRFFWDSKFDQGMTAFLECLRQFKEAVESGDTKFALPYRVQKDRLEDTNNSYSIRIQLNSEEHWTKALKFMLTNLKWGLAWVASQFPDG